MKKKSLLLTSTITAVFLAAVFVFVWMRDAPPSSLESASESITSSTVVGLIVPHYEPVSFLTKQALEQVHTEPDLIILIGPNHFEAGQGRILTGNYRGQNFGRPFQFAEDEMQHLLNTKIALREDKIISKEHSIGTPLPLLQERFPKAKILPIILKYHQSQEDIDRLIATLQKFSDQDILIVGSIDFSHYRSSDIAPLFDDQTQKYIVTRDYQKIQTLNNDYVDSPWGLILLLQYLEKRGVISQKVIAHTNTGLVAGETIESSTSFLTYIFE